MTNQQGARCERELVNLLDEMGFAVMRAPASGSATARDLPDVLAGNGERFYAIEAKSSSGDPIGERLATVADEQGILLMHCDRCATMRGLAEHVEAHESGRPNFEPRNVADGVIAGCFPDRYTALDDGNLDQVITL